MTGRYGGFRLKLKDEWIRDDFASIHQAVIYKFVDPEEDYANRTSFIGSVMFAMALAVCDLADAVREHGKAAR